MCYILNVMGGRLVRIVINYRAFISRGSINWPCVDAVLLCSVKINFIDLQKQYFICELGK